MGLKVYNTLTGTKEPFEPLVPGKVRMYMCGPTVWDFIHVGNARALLAADLFKRYLRFRGYEVVHVQNVTDVEDKIIRKAQELEVGFQTVVETYHQAYAADLERLGCLPADVNPKASEHIELMVEAIERLVANDHAYVVDGDVYYAVESFAAYGKLSGQHLEDLQAGARVETGERKRHPGDFALWKAAKPGEPAWESPWGPGRPGWHIECSVMSMHYLGESFDIHSGGHDLVFPHHENEIAQSEALTGKAFVRYWLHTGYITHRGEKMSKSLGNVRNLRDVLDRHDPEVVRLFLLSTHYRSPMEFSEEGLEATARALARLRGVVEALKGVVDGQARSDGHSNSQGHEGVVSEAPLTAAVRQAEAQFTESMDDDFNTSAGLATLHTLAREVNRWLHTPADERPPGTTAGFEAALLAFRKLGAVFGILEHTGGNEGDGDSTLVGPLVELLIELREEARKSRSFETADAIRDRLAGLGIELQDTPKGTKWKRVASV